MIVLTRINGAQFALNPDLIERAESTPDTVITLVDTTKYVVSEGLLDIVAAIRDFRASVIATAQAIEDGAHVPRPLLARTPSGDSTGARLVPFPSRES